MKWTLAILSFINGAYMLLDGVFVLIKGKYIGPDKPGPWANLFYKLNVDVFKLGPLFIVFGIAWLVFIYGILTKQAWVFNAGIVLPVLSLWYLPFGTLISIAVIILIVLSKNTL